MKVSAIRVKTCRFLLTFYQNIGKWKWYTIFRFQTSLFRWLWSTSKMVIAVHRSTFQYELQKYRLDSRGGVAGAVYRKWLLSPTVRFWRCKNAAQHSKEKDKWPKRCNEGPIVLPDQLHTIGMLLGDSKSKWRYLFATHCDGNKSWHVWTASSTPDTSFLLHSFVPVARDWQRNLCHPVPPWTQILSSFK